MNPSGVLGFDGGRVHTGGVEFVYLKIPAGRPGRGPEHALHAALEAALTGAGLGSLLAWGASVGDRDAGPLTPRHHRIDIEVTALEPALALLRERLLALDVPVGTELHYTDAGQALQQDLAAGGWQPPRATTAATAHGARRAGLSR